MVSRFISQRGRQVGGPSDAQAWREVGWIFSNGETLAIERCGEQIRVREGLIHP